MSYMKPSSLYDGKLFDLPCPMDEELDFQKTLDMLSLTEIDLREMDSMRKNMKISIQASPQGGINRCAALCETILQYLKQLIKLTHVVQHFPCFFMKRPKHNWIRWQGSPAFVIKENEPTTHMAAYYDKLIETNNWRVELILTCVTFAMCSMNFGILYRDTKKAIMHDGAQKAFKMAFTVMHYAIDEFRKIRFHDGLMHVPELKHDVLLSLYNAAVSLYLFRLAYVVRPDPKSRDMAVLKDFVCLGMKAQEFATISLALSRTLGEDPSTEFSIYLANERSRQTAIVLSANADLVDGKATLDFDAHLLMYRLLRTAYEELANVIDLCEKVNCSFASHTKLQGSIKEQMDGITVSTMHKKEPHVNYLTVVLSSFDAETKEIDQLIANTTESEKHAMGIIVRKPIVFQYDESFRGMYSDQYTGYGDDSIFLAMCNDSVPLDAIEEHASDSEDKEDPTPLQEQQVGEPADWSGGSSEDEQSVLIDPMEHSEDAHTAGILVDSEAVPLEI